MELLKKSSVRSESYVNFEFVKPFCTCGKELSSIFFELTARESFAEIMKEIIKDDELLVMSTIFQRKMEHFSTNQEDPLKFCCKLSLRFGRSHPLSLEDPREGVRKDHPPISLPGALNRRKSIYWSS